VHGRALTAGLRKVGRTDVYSEIKEGY
jgi:hypothetical protein